LNEKSIVMLQSVTDDRRADSAGKNRVSLPSMSAVGIVAANRAATRSCPLLTVDNRIGDAATQIGKLLLEQQDVTADSRDIAVVMHLIGRHFRIEELDLPVVGGRASHRNLRTRVVLELKRIGSRVDSDGGDIRTVQPIQVGHPAAIGPSGDIHAIAIDSAACFDRSDEMIDRGRVDIFRVDLARDRDGARRIELPIPLIPAGAGAIGRRIVMRGVATLRREQDKARPRRIVADVCGLEVVEKIGVAAHAVGVSERRMKVDNQRQGL
jgi:hypothetical protein